MSFLKWCFDQDDWVFALTFLSIVLGAIAYLFIVTALVQSGQVMGGLLFLLLPFVAAWRAAYRRFKADRDES